jgi:hypothetical protein
MPKKPKYVWPINLEDPPLTVELRPVFGRDAVFIERENGGLIVISLPEAQALAELLPRVVAEALQDQ